MDLARRDGGDASWRRGGADGEASEVGAELGPRAVRAIMDDGLAGDFGEGITCGVYAGGFL